MVLFWVFLKDDGGSEFSSDTAEAGFSYFTSTDGHGIESGVCFKTIGEAVSGDAINVEESAISFYASLSNRIEYLYFLANCFK